MKEQYTYSVSVMGKQQGAGRYRAATPERKGAKSTINTWGLTNEPLLYRTLQTLLDELEPLTGKLSYSKVYREVVQQGLSAVVVDAWSNLTQHYEPMDKAVLLITRYQAPTGLQGVKPVRR